MNYYVVVIIASFMWLYSPLLVYYLPSSEPTAVNYPPDLNSRDFIPTYTSPVYFGNLLRCVLCFYVEKNKDAKSRVRRLIFIFCSFGVSFRFWYTPYWSMLVFLMPVFLIGVSIYRHIGACFSIMNIQPTSWINGNTQIASFEKIPIRKSTNSLLIACRKDFICWWTDDFSLCWSVKVLNHLSSLARGQIFIEFVPLTLNSSFCLFLHAVSP